VGGLDRVKRSRPRAVEGKKGKGPTGLGHVGREEKGKRRLGLGSKEEKREGKEQERVGRAQLEKEGEKELDSNTFEF
jgi:hypothetical protein